MKLSVCCLRNSDKIEISSQESVALNFIVLLISAVSSLLSFETVVTHDTQKKITMQQNSMVQFVDLHSIEVNLGLKWRNPCKKNPYQ